MKTTRFMLMLTYILIVGLSLGGLGCPKSDETSNVEASDEGSALGTNIVTDVSVPSGDRVQIKGQGRLDANPFAMEDPYQINVDIQGAVMAPGLDKEVGGQGAITSVKVDQVAGVDPPVVRVTINLSSNMTFNVDREMGMVVIMLSPAPEAPPEPELLPYDETKKELERIQSGAPPDVGEFDMSEFQRYQATGEAPPPPFVRDLPPGNSDGSMNALGDIYLRVIEDGLQIMLYGNGSAGQFVDFNLVSPPRLVIDLYGVQKMTKRTDYRIGWGGVSNVRIGRHSDKVRVVIDFTGRLKAYEVTNTPTGVVITVHDIAYVPGGFRYTVHVTGQGESFRSIAQQEYGNSEAWPRLLSANREFFTPAELRAFDKSDGSLPLGVGLEVKVPTR